MDQSEGMALFRKAETIILEEVPVSLLLYINYLRSFSKIMGIEILPLLIGDIPWGEIILDPDLENN